MWNRKQWLTLVLVAVLVRWIAVLLFVYPSISPNAVAALRSHNQTAVSLAIMSSKTSNDFIMLAPAFLSMRIRDTVFLPLSVLAPWAWFDYFLVTGY